MMRKNAFRKKFLIKNKKQISEGYKLWYRGWASPLSREIPIPVLTGTPNFRDIGGLPTLDGRRVRSGLVYRTEGPVHLTAEDEVSLRSIGLSIVCDLRSAGEREAEPNSWCAQTDIELIHMDVSEDLKVKGHQQWNALFENPSAAAGRDAMLASYRAKPAAMIPQLRILFSRIVDAGQLPLLIHCTAGKDRTGVMVAMLLTALGVTKEAIYADYLRSGDCRAERFASSIKAGFMSSFGRLPDRTVIDALISVEPAFLDASFEAAGPMDRYLSDDLGLDEKRRERLRSILLEPAV